MTLWIVIGVFSIAVLGVVCSWILNARGGLEAGSRAESTKASPSDLDRSNGIQNIPRSTG